jgi:type IV pilus assembly protein PilX
MKAHHVRRGTRQQGAALIVSLIMLLVMTVLAVTATRTTTLQERMAGNLRNKAIAFEAAETTLRVGEAWVEARVGGERPVAVDIASCGSPPCDVLANGDLDPLAPGTWSGSDVRTGPSLAQTAADPQYYIEQQQIVRDSLNVGQSTDQNARIYYRITARAVGGDTTAESVLRSTYAARF